MSKSDRPKKGKWLSEPRRIARGTKRAENEIMQSFREGRRIIGSGSRVVARGFQEEQVVALQPFGSTRLSRARSRTDGGDGIAKVYFVEHKRTRKTSYSIQYEDLRVLRDAARDNSRIPLFVISFQNPQVLEVKLRAKPYLEWCLMPWPDLKDRLDAGTVYYTTTYAVPNKSFGWTRLRLREAVAVARAREREPVVMLHFIPTPEEPELAIQEGRSDPWVLMPLKEALILEGTA